MYVCKLSTKTSNRIAWAVSRKPVPQIDVVRTVLVLRSREFLLHNLYLTATLTQVTWLTSLRPTRQPALAAALDIELKLVATKLFFSTARTPPHRHLNSRWRSATDKRIWILGIFRIESNDSAIIGLLGNYDLFEFIFELAVIVGDEKKSRFTSVCLWNHH